MTLRTDPSRVRRHLCGTCFDLPHRRAQIRHGCPGCGKHHEAELLEPAYQQLASPLDGMQSW